MAITLNAKGTSVPYFKIGKSGTTLFQGDEDPHVNDGYNVQTNDIWFDTAGKTLKFRTSSQTWQALAEADKISEMTDVNLDGLADGNFLRYDSSSNSWTAHDVIGGLGSDWGSISDPTISIDGYTGDIWQYDAHTDNLIHTGPVDINGILTTTAIVSPTINNINTQIANLKTDDIPEQTNLYHTETRVRAAISVSGGSLSYDNTTGVISYTDTDSSYATKVGYNLADETDTASIVLNPGDAVTPATYRGDVIDNNGNIIVDVSSTNATFSGGLMGTVYGDVYNPTGANKILESGTGNLDSVLTVDTATATTLNAGITNISGNTVFTGSSVDFTGTNTIGNWNGAVYDRTGSTLIIEDNATPGPIVHADLEGDVTGDVTGNLTATDSLTLPTGTVAQRPSTPAEGMMWFNTTTKKFEGYDGTGWIVFSPEDLGSISGTSGITYNYDFSNISYVNTLTFNLTDTSGGAAIAPRGAFVHPDGTYYFWADPSTDKVYRSEMSTAYDITSISGTPQTLSVSTQEGAASDVFLGDSGTKLYITGSISDKVHQYDLSTAYDLTTASFNQSITTRPSEFTESVPWSLHFKSDGTKMYVVGKTRDSVGEFDLSTAWDISTATFSQSFSFSSQSTAVDAFTMSADGTKMYHGDGYNGTIYRYSLSTAWDVSTASYAGATDLESIPNAPSNVNTYGMCFDTAGDRLYVTDSSDKLHQFSLE